MAKYVMTAQDLEAAKNAKRIWMTKKTELGLTQSQLAKLLGVGQSAVASWFNGHTPIGTNALLMIATIFNVDPREIRPEFAYKIVQDDLPEDVARICSKIVSLPIGVRADIERTIDTIISSNYVGFLQNIESHAQKINKKIKVKPTNK